SELQLTVLEAMQIDEYIRHETEAAERLAMRLDNIDIIDSHKISDKYSILETIVTERYIGKNPKEADLTNQYKVIVLTTIRKHQTEQNGKIQKTEEVTGIAKSTTILQENDILVLFGELKHINRLIKQ